MRRQLSVVSGPWRHRGHQGGFTLLEMLLVMAMLGVLTGALILILKEALRVEQVQAIGFDKLLQDTALADQFRADAAQAISAPGEWGDFKVGRGTLVLQMPSGDHVVYVWNDKTLLRRAYENGAELVRSLAVASDWDVEFARDAQNPKLVYLLLHASSKGKLLSGQALEFGAALGGDWR